MPKSIGAVRSLPTAISLNLTPPFQPVGLTSQTGAQALPVPTYHAGDSQKAPWLVIAEELAKYLGKRRAEAYEMWKVMN